MSFPYDDDVSLAQIEKWMMELEEEGLVKTYFGGRKNHRFGEVTSWKEHQKINRPRPSKLPEPTENHRSGEVTSRKKHQKINVPKSPEPPGTPVNTGESEESLTNHGRTSERSRSDHGRTSERSRKDHGAITDVSLLERKGREGKVPPYIPPKQGGMMFFPLEEALARQKRKRMPESLKKSIKLRCEPDERMLLTGKCFSRRRSTLWTYYEGERFAALDPPLEECKLMQRFYSRKTRTLNENGTNLWKSDLETLLNQWQAQLDRAMALVGDISTDEQREEVPAEPDGWRERLAMEFPEAKPSDWNWNNLYAQHPEIAERVVG